MPFRCGAADRPHRVLRHLLSVTSGELLPLSPVLSGQPLRPLCCIAMTSETASLDAKLVELRTLIRGLGSALVCFSGGTDSALVLAIATEQLGQRAIGMTALSPSLPQAEQQDAARIARQLGAEHRLVASNEIERPEYAANAPDRCYHCRTVLYEIARQKCIEWDLSQVLNGTNTDDFGDYRPGLQAAREAGVRSPLAEVGFSKAHVREAARRIGLDVWDKPAAACLSSRIPYGTRVTPERLAQIGGFEAALKELGFVPVRVRWHDTVARIELDLADLDRVLSPQLRARIVAAGREHGFQYVAVDLAGYRTGSHNEVLDSRRLKVLR